MWIYSYEEFLNLSYEELLIYSYEKIIHTHMKELLKSIGKIMDAEYEEAYCTKRRGGSVFFL